MVKKRTTSRRPAQPGRARPVRAVRNPRWSSPGIRLFRVDLDAPTVVRVTGGGISLGDIRMDIPHTATGDAIVIPPIGPGLAVSVDFDVVTERFCQGEALGVAEPINVEIVSGPKTYRQILQTAGLRHEVRFSLFYGEPGPNLLDCPRHGLVRPVKGRCPEAPPHTPII